MGALAVAEKRTRESVRQRKRLPKNYLVFEIQLSCYELRLDYVENSEGNLP